MAPSPRPLFSPIVVACCAILAGAAVGLEPTLKALIRTYSKEPIALRKPLQEFDTSGIESLIPIRRGAFFNLTSSDDVGTEDVLRICFADPDRPDRRDLQVLLFVTYYSDPRDRIPHTPEVCYRQGGATVRRLWIEPLEVDVPGDSETRITTRALDIHQRGWSQLLLYAFCSNGRFYDGRLKVRWAMGLPGDSHVYFSKIEVVTPIPDDTTEADAMARCKRVLREAIPVLVGDHYPTRTDVSRRPGRP